MAVGDAPYHCSSCWNYHPTSGTCRRYAPTPLTAEGQAHVTWPQVAVDAGCGEWVDADDPDATTPGDHNRSVRVLNVVDVQVLP